MRTIFWPARFQCRFHRHHLLDLVAAPLSPASLHPGQRTSTPRLAILLIKDFLYLLQLKIVVGKHRQHLTGLLNPHPFPLKSKRADFFIGLFNGICEFSTSFTSETISNDGICNLETHQNSLF